MHADYKMTQLRQKELDVLVRELAQLLAEDIVNPHVVGVAAVATGGISDWRCRRRRKPCRRDTVGVESRFVSILVVGSAGVCRRLTRGMRRGEKGWS